LNNKKYGKGDFQYENGAFYTGEWVDDLKEG